MNAVSGWIESKQWGAGARPGSDWPVNVVLWLLATVIAVFFATLLKESAILDGEYLPRANDSLYHARRILDTAIGERGFYQFDERLHVPDGAWIPWPWGYDYLVAQTLRLALWFKPALDPMAFLSYITVFWLGINVALFLACLRAAGLGAGLCVVAMLGFSLSPLIQLLHATGTVDHHFMELSFVLLAVWLGVRWLRKSDNWKAAALLGVALGLAPAFHNGLFILQLPLLASIFLLWLKGVQIPFRSTRALAAALIATTILILLPSAAFQAGLFEFALLSWFHLYIAVCTGATLLLLSARGLSRKSFGLLTGLVAVLALPIVAQTLRGAMFFSGDMLGLDQILEAQSPLRMLRETVGPVETASYYSWLILAAPLFCLLFAWRAFRSAAPQVLFYSVWGVFGLSFLLLQYRFNYFGLLFLLSGPLLMLDSATQRFGWKPNLTVVAALAGLLVLYQPVLRDRLFEIYAPGGDRNYAGALRVYDHLADVCGDEPRLVLASSDDGNPILYHTNCTVIANNFIMRPEDERKHAIVQGLMQSTPETIRRFEPAIDYLFLRARDYSLLIDGKEVIDGRSPIARQLLLAEEPPEGFETTKTILYLPDENSEPELYARVYRVTPLRD